MLIALALLVSLQTVSATDAAANSGSQDEILVISRKLRDWRGSLKSMKRGTRCITKRSTGDREVDQIGCEAMTTCWPKLEADFKSALGATTDRTLRAERTSEINRQMSACFQAQHDALTEALAERRAAARRP